MNASPVADRPAPTISGACPTFLRALCRDAAHGGTGGYEHVGYTLAGAAAGLLDHRDDDELAEKLDAYLAAFCHHPPAESWGRSRLDDALVLGWFDRELPRCMALIPARRRGQFLKGVYRAVVEEEQDVFTL